MILYSQFEEYVREEVIRDRAFFQSNNNHFLRIANQAILEFARDLNTIDADFYYEESQAIPMTEGVPINLGPSLGFSGAYFKNSAASFNRKTSEVPRLKRGNHKTAYGIQDWYDDQGDLYVQFVNNTGFPLHIDTSSIILMWSRKPHALTGVPGQELDIPEQAKYPLGILIKYYYYLFRDFYDEADRMAIEYRGYMNKYIKKKKPSVLGTQFGKPFLSAGNSLITFR